MATEVTLVAGEWPVGWCYSTGQNLLDTVADHLSASIAGTSNSFNYGPTVPSADQRDRPWHRTDANFTPDKVYTWSTLAAAWVAPVSPGNFPGKVIMYEGDISLIDALDGGEAGAATAFTGVMWTKLSAIDGKMPIGPGTLDQGTVVALAGTGGTEKVSLTEAETAPHDHDVQGRNLVELGGVITPTNETPDRIIIDDDYIGGTVTKSTESAGGTGTPAVVTPHQNMPPFYGIWFIKKSVRTHYRV